MMAKPIVTPEMLRTIYSKMTLAHLLDVRAKLQQELQILDSLISEKSPEVTPDE